MADFTTRMSNPSQTPAEPTLKIGRFDSPTQQSELKNFFSNLKDFLTERRVKFRGGQPAVFVPPSFGDGTGSNLKELFRRAPRGSVNSDLLVSWNAGFGGLWQNLRDLISPPKLPPLQTTSQPVAVPEIWSKNTQFTRVQALSVTIHVVLLVLIVLPLIPGLLMPATTKANSKVDVIAISPFLPKLPPGNKKAGGGGGAHDPRPASVGKLPKFAMTQFTPPKVVTNPNARLAMTPTVLGPPELKLPSPNMNNWGDPLSKVLNDSNGPGSGNGIGSGNGTGVGSGSGGGVGPGEGGGTGGGVFNAGTNGYGVPACIYCPPAEYSDEAVKAKYQGTVTLVAIITPDGKATDIKVVKGLGLGLDEKAIERVRTWRFTAAKGPNGRPAPVRQIIEVTFHLY